MSTTGFDDTNAVLRVKPGVKFKLEGSDALYRKLGAVDGHEEGHICHPNSTTLAVLIRDEEGTECFHLVRLKVRSLVDSKGHAGCAGRGKCSCGCTACEEAHDGARSVLS